MNSITNSTDASNNASSPATAAGTRPAVTGGLRMVKFEAKLLQNLASNGYLFLFDRATLKSEAANYRAIVRRHLKGLGRPLIDIDAVGKTDKDVLRSLRRVLERKLKRNNTPIPDKEGKTEYRVVRELFDASGSGTLCIHSVHKLSPEGLHMVSRFAEHARTNNLRWQFVLLGGIVNIPEMLIARLDADYVYPNRQSLKEAKQLADYNDPAALSNRQIVSVFLISMTLLGGALYTYERGLPTNAVAAFNTHIGANIDWQIPESWTTGFRKKDSGSNVAEIAALQTGPIGGNDRARLQTEDQSLVNNPLQTSGAVASNSGDVDEPIVSYESINEPVANQPRLAMSAELEQSLGASDIGAVKDIYAAGDTFGAVNARDETALIIASINDDAAMVKLLLNIDARLDARDEKDRTALFYAAMGGDQSIVNALVKAGADVNSASELGKTPLMVATQNNHLAAAEILLENGANPDLVDHAGWSALFYAAWNDSVTLGHLLINNDAQRSLLDRDGNSASVVAEARGNQLLASLLTEPNESQQLSPVDADAKASVAQEEQTQ